jgi:predicted nucleotidyltransferase
MRLLKPDIEIIKRVAFELWGDKVLVYLFGSRTDDSKKGGDIDLYIQLNKEYSPREIMLQKAEFLAKLDLLLGEQKIDVLIKTPYNNDLPIIKTAQLTGVLL